MTLSTAPTLERTDHEIEHLDFAPHCEAPSGCEHEAEWAARCRYCRRCGLLCVQHRDAMVKRHDEAPPGLLIVCPECRHFVRERHWRALIEILPIGGL